MAARQVVHIKRKTAGTQIQGSLKLDGTGKTQIKTGIEFLDHALTQFAFHGCFDLTLHCKSGAQTGKHHANEDSAIALGEAFQQALGDKRGIQRYGCAFVPMDETEVRVDLDIGDRYFFSGLRRSEVMPVTGQPHEDSDYSYRDLKDFLSGFSRSLGMNLHVSVLYPGQDLRHEAEAIFKALGRAMDQATQIDRRRKNAPTTKGLL